MEPVTFSVLVPPAKILASRDFARAWLETVERSPSRFVSLAVRLRPRWIVWENVPGILSVDRGYAFAAFLDLLGERGYGVAYRVLDARYFGVPQRRRRVFVIGHLGDWRPAAAVFFEPESLRGDTSPSREAREDVTSSLTRSAGHHGYSSARGGREPDAGPQWGDFLSDGSTFTLNCTEQHAVATVPTLTGNPYGDHKSREGLLVVSDTANQTEAVAFQEAQTGVREYTEARSLRANGPGHDPVGTRVRNGTSVRLLTPRECERLQGFPDDYTLVPFNGKPVTDGHRYRALGNSMAVPVMRWIGERVQMVQELLDERG